MFQFRKGYFLVAVILLIVEILIAAFVHDRVIRPYIGDLLVVILIYCTVKSFLNIPIIPLAIGVLLFAYLIEVLQYLHFIKWIGIDKNELARIILGVGFSWIDMLCYTIGVILVVFVELKINKKKMEH